MKKYKENKKPCPTKPKPKAPKTPNLCTNCTSKYCPGSAHPVTRKRSNLTPKSSKTSISTKASKISISNQCNCGSYLDHATILNMMPDDDVCSCGVFAKALRSNIHMNIGTLIHQEECKPPTNETDI